VNRRTAEQGTAECRSEIRYLISLKTSAVSAGGGVGLPATTPAMRARRGGLAFDIQNTAKQILSHRRSPCAGKDQVFIAQISKMPDK
jgi:hypothetical protein